MNAGSRSERRSPRSTTDAPGTRQATMCTRFKPAHPPAACRYASGYSPMGGSTSKAPECRWCAGTMIRTDWPALCGALQARRTGARTTCWPSRVERPARCICSVWDATVPPPPAVPTTLDGTSPSTPSITRTPHESARPVRPPSPTAPPAAVPVAARTPPRHRNRSPTDSTTTTDTSTGESTTISAR